MKNVYIDTSELDREFGNLIRVIKEKGDFSTTLKKQVPVLQDNNKENFKSKGLVRKWDKKPNGDFPTMIKTGRLKKSLVSKTSDSILKVGKKELILGTSIDYGFYHQKGIRGRVRETLQIGKKAEKKILKNIEEDFYKSINDALNNL